MLLEEESSQIVDTYERGGVPGAKCALVSCQSALEKQLGLAIATLRLIQLGAVLALLADVHLGRLCAMSATPSLALVTSNLMLNYLSAAKIGNWLEASGQVDRVGRTFAHSTGIVLANGKPVLRACGAFQIITSPQ